MNRSIYRISLDIRNTNSQLSIPIKLRDTNRRLCISLRDGGKAFEITQDCIAVFCATKSDGKKVLNNCVISNNQIIYDVTEQTVADIGLVDCEIRLYGSNDAIITSPKFILVVDPRAVSDEDVTISTDEKSAIDQMLLAEATRQVQENERQANTAAAIEKAIAISESLETELPKAELYANTAERSATEAKESESTALKAEERAEASAVEAAEFASQAEQSVSSTLGLIDQHNNADENTHVDIRNAVKTAEAIARGKAKSICFDTEEDLRNWVNGTFQRSDGRTVSDLTIGDNLYILELDVPDYWWDGNEIQPLGAEKPDLSDLVKKEEIAAQLGGSIFNTMSRSEYDAAYASGELQAGTIYFVYED